MARNYKKRNVATDDYHRRATAAQKKKAYRQRIATAITTAIKRRPKVPAVIRKRVAERQRRYYAKTDKRLHVQ